MVDFGRMMFLNGISSLVMELRLLILGTGREGLRS